MTQPPDDHLKALWKGQETETTPMSVDAIRTRAATYHAKTRRHFVVKLVACIVVAFFFAAYVVWLSPTPIMRVGWAISAFGAVWMALQLRGRWPGDLPQDEGSGTALVDFHRGLILRQRLRLRSFAVAAGPMLFGVVVATAGLVLKAGDLVAERLAPIAVLFAIWAVLMWVVARRQRRSLQRELDELDRG